jgi:hypothetical protein
VKSTTCRWCIRNTASTEIAASKTRWAKEQKARSAKSTSPARSPSRGPASWLISCVFHDIIDRCRIMPVARSTSASSLRSGNPQPFFCDPGCGHVFCKAGRSGVSAVVASTILTRRPRHVAADSSCLPPSPHSDEATAATPARGSCARAAQ